MWARVADPPVDDAAGELADLVSVGDAVGGGQGQGFLDLARAIPMISSATSRFLTSPAASLLCGFNHRPAVAVDDLPDVPDSTSTVAISSSPPMPATASPAG